MKRASNVIEQVEKEIEKEESAAHGADQTSRAEGTSCELQEEKAMAPGPVSVDEVMVSSIRRIVRPLLFERSLKRRVPSVTGTRFCPSRFYEIKTNPKAPRIRKEVKKIGRAIDETALALAFDRSGSMSGQKEKVAMELATVFYKALAPIHKLHIQILGFNDRPSLIKAESPISMDTVLRRIPLALKAKGGTNFPLALQQSIRCAQDIPARKKLVIILTDGDVSGSINIDELKSHAEKRKVELFVIGVKGCDPDALHTHFGKENTLYVKRIENLGEELRRIVSSRI